MSRKGAYIGGSTVIQLGSVGGPERPRRAEEPASVAFPRSGGALVVVPQNKAPTKPHMAHQTFKKFRRRANDLISWLPYLNVGHQQTARALARIQRRVEEIAGSEYVEDAAAEAAGLAKKFHALKERLGTAEVARAKFAEREAKRSNFNDVDP